MTTCTKCKGEGLMGSGDMPELKHGAISTCDICNGTGIILDAPVALAPTVEPTIPEDTEGSAPSAETEAIQENVAPALGQTENQDGIKPSFIEKVVDAVFGDTTA